MSREEEAIRATTRVIAATVRDVPPLRLEPAPDELWFPGQRPRRARRGGRGPRLLPWLAPVAAAAVVVAVAISLVLVRGPQNGGVVPQPALTSSVPGGVPRYYVALDPVTGKPGATNGLLVGDTFTGQALADITPPAGMSYQSVTAAADDRTFLAFATESGQSSTTGRWYRLVLAPGTAHLVTLTSTAIAPQSGVVGSALSGSGKYLAVAERGPAKGQQRVVVFLVATGYPLVAWGTRTAPAMWSVDTVQQDLLTWIDGDRAIAFSGVDVARDTESVRRLSFPVLSGQGDLIADSQLIWSAPASAGPSWASAGTPPMVSADGKTIACAAFSAKPSSAWHEQWTSSWRVYPVSAQAPAAGRYTIAYQVTGQARVPYTSLSNLLWISPSGSAVVGAWAVAPVPVITYSSPAHGNGSGTSTALLLDPVGALRGATVHVGVMSHGTFTPLRLPRDVLSFPAYAIAW
jgi:hypothetical protein